MVDLSLPFWILIDPEGKSAPCAFSTTRKLADFLDTENLGRWSKRHIGDCESLLHAIADAHQQGAGMVWLDPEAGAEPGDSIQLVDLVELHERLRHTV